MPINNFSLENHKKGFPQPTTGRRILRENEKNPMLKGNEAAIKNYEKEFPSRFEQK